MSNHDYEEVDITPVDITPPHRVGGGFRGLDEVAKRLGVAPWKPSDGKQWLIVSESGQSFEPFKIVQALLDRLDAASTSPIKP